MQKTYSYLCATLALAAIILASCTPPKKIVRTDYIERASKIRTIGILAPDINFYELSFGGVREKDDAETELVNGNIAEALKAELSGRGFAVKLIPRAGEQKQDLDEMLGLFSKIAGSYHAHVTPENSLSLFPHKAESFDYSVGVLDTALDPNHADALFLVAGFCESNSLLVQGRTVIIMSLADRTGALLWYERYLGGAPTERNVRNPESAVRVVRKLFKSLPEVPR